MQTNLQTWKKTSYFSFVYDVLKWRHHIHCRRILCLNWSQWWPSFCSSNGQRMARPLEQRKRNSCGGQVKEGGRISSTSFLKLGKDEKYEHQNKDFIRNEANRIEVHALSEIVKRICQYRMSLPFNDTDLFVNSHLDAKCLFKATRVCTETHDVSLITYQTSSRYSIASQQWKATLTFGCILPCCIEADPTAFINDFKLRIRFVTEKLKADIQIAASLKYCTSVKNRALNCYFHDITDMKISCTVTRAYINWIPSYCEKVSDFVRQIFSKINVDQDGENFVCFAIPFDSFLYKVEKRKTQTSGD